MAKGKHRIKAKTVKARVVAQTTAAPAVAAKPQEKGSAKVIDYGKGNKLPQEIIKAFLASPTSRRCWRRLKKFIQADGFADRTAAAVQVNPLQRADDLLGLIAWDLAPGFGFALRVKYNLGREVGEVQYVPFQTVRKLDDGRFVVNPTLGTDKHKQDEDEILDAFDNSEEGITRSLSQLDKEGNPQPGQLLYIYEETGSHPHYPEPDAWSAKEDILSDTEIQRADYNAIRKRVKPNIGVYFPYEIDDETTDENDKTDWDNIEEQVRQLTDPEGEGDAVVFNGESKEGAPQLISIDSMKSTLSMDQKSEIIRKRICIAFGVHPALIGLDTAGQLGNTQQLLNLIQLMQQEVLDAQGQIQRAFQRLWPAFDWKLTSLNILKALPEQVWQTMTENEKRNFMGYADIEENEQLNKFNRLPDELKAKAAEAMTPEQVLALAGIEIKETLTPKPNATNAKAADKGRLSTARAYIQKLINR